MWRPTKKEIQDWVDERLCEFSRSQNKNLRLSTKQWLQRYIYTDFHERFFFEFPMVLAEWLQRLIEKSGRIVSQRKSEELDA
jgi:hypothetical protein